MSKFLVKTVQIGRSSDATKNFTLTAAQEDGSIKLSRGLLGATTQDVLTVDSSGTVKTPQNAVAFLANKTTSQVSTAPGSNGPILFNSEAFDLKNSYDPATGRFTPTTAGYYQINFSVGSFALGVRFFALLMKNGIEISRGSDVLVTSSTYGGVYGSTGSTIVFLNGSSDYLTVNFYADRSGLEVGSSAPQTAFSGFLAVAA